MKKIMKNGLFFIILFISFLSNISADTWTQEKLEGDNVIKEKRYRYYYLEKVGKYIRIDKESSYLFEDEDDIIYGEFSNWTSNKITPYDYLDIEYGTKYQYMELLPAQFIKIENITNNDIVINNIKTYNLTANLDYKIYSCTNCNSEKTVIYPEGEMVIWMPMSVLIKNLTFYFEVESSGCFNIIYSYDRNFTKVVASTTGFPNSVAYKYDFNFEIFDCYTNVLEGYNIVVDEFIKVIDTITVSRSREIYNFRYNYEKIYIDENYYRDIDDIDFDDLWLSKDRVYMDEDDYKFYYRYLTYEEQEINDVVKVGEIDTINVTKPVSNNISLVKTGIKKRKNYSYLITYVLGLILMALLFIKSLNKKRNFK